MTHASGTLYIVRRAESFKRTNTRPKCDDLISKYFSLTNQKTDICGGPSFLVRSNAGMFAKPFNTTKTEQEEMEQGRLYILFNVCRIK
jgi:hypothetical protein